MRPPLPSNPEARQQQLLARISYLDEGWQNDRLRMMSVDAEGRLSPPDETSTSFGLAYLSVVGAIITLTLWSDGPVRAIFCGGAIAAFGMIRHSIERRRVARMAARRMTYDREKFQLLQELRQGMPAAEPRPSAAPRKAPGSAKAQEILTLGITP